MVYAWMVIGLVVLGLSITTVSGVRVSYKTAHATTDTQRIRIAKLMMIPNHRLRHS